jgi:hypothetical protein
VGVVTHDTARWFERAKEDHMSVASVIETSATSETSFEDAIQQGIARATKTLRNVEGAWVKDQQVQIKDGQIVGYQVNLKITFVMEEPEA